MTNGYQLRTNPLAFYFKNELMEKPPSLKKVA